MKMCWKFMRIGFLFDKETHLNITEQPNGSSDRTPYKNLWKGGGGRCHKTYVQIVQLILLGWTIAMASECCSQKHPLLFEFDFSFPMECTSGIPASPGRGFPALFPLPWCGEQAVGFLEDKEALVPGRQLKSLFLTEKLRIFGGFPLMRHQLPFLGRC